jgi:hypothetical protein
MKSINSIATSLFLFFTFLFNSQKASGQHLLEYGGTQKVIKVITEKGGALYYRNWPDTIEGATRAILVSDITSLKPLRYEEVDSVFARLSTAEEQKQKRNVEIVLANKIFARKVLVELDLNSAVTVNRFDWGGGLSIGGRGKDGKVEVLTRIGLDQTNQGRGFIYTRQIPLSIGVNYHFFDHKWKDGIPFIQAAAGNNLVLAGKFDTTRERNRPEYYNYEKEVLDNNLFFCLGGGMLYHKVRLGLAYKLQGSNVKYPEIGYMHFLMIKVAMKIL